MNANVYGWSLIRDKSLIQYEEISLMIWHQHSPKKSYGSPFLTSRMWFRPKLGRPGQAAGKDYIMATLPLFCPSMSVAYYDIFLGFCLHEPLPQQISPVPSWPLHETLSFHSTWQITLYACPLSLTTFVSLWACTIPPQCFSWNLCLNIGSNFLPWHNAQPSETWNHVSLIHLEMRFPWKDLSKAIMVTQVAGYSEQFNLRLQHV